MRAHRRTTFAIAVALFGIGTTSRVEAAPSEGEQLFREGRAAMQARDFDRACTKFAESQKKEPAPGTALNLGDCEEQRGHLIAATEAFTLAASTFTSPDKQKYATSRAEAADKRIPRLTIRATTKIPGLVVHVGAATVTVDAETKLDPGEVVVRAEAPDHRPKQLKATLREAKNLEIDIGSLEPERATASPNGTPSTTASVGAARPAGSPDLRTIGLVAGGVGVASLVVGGVTGLLTLGHASTVEEHCTPDLACDAEGLDAAQSGETLSLVSTITVIGGSALVAGGIALYVIGSKRAAAAKTGSIFRTIAPAVSRDAASITVGGTF